MPVSIQFGLQGILSTLDKRKNINILMILCLTCNLYNNAFRDILVELMYSLWLYIMHFCFFFLWELFGVYTSLIRLFYFYLNMYLVDGGDVSIIIACNFTT